MSDSPDTELPKIKKSATVLTDDCYNTPQTSLLLFHFEPHPFTSSKMRMQNSQVKHASVDNKDIFLIDHFFSADEGMDNCNYCRKTTFSRNSYGSAEAIMQGEKPAKSMDGKERWQFFSRPPKGIHELYKLFSWLAFHLDADISTLPWELCDKSSHISSSVICNLLEKVTEESRELGKHQDCNPEKGIAFGIPVLYGEDQQFHSSKFVNGDPGKPWLITVMLYTTAENFTEDHRMGTAFYSKNGQLVLRSKCLSMRLVFFESDIFHSIEESTIPKELQTWRVSYVFKLLVNPKKNTYPLREALARVLQNEQIPIEIVSLGAESRR